MKVCKFGGTSVATKSRLERVRGIVLSDAERTVVVVSAPGKVGEGQKLTDLLVEAYREIKTGGGAEFCKSEISNRFALLCETDSELKKVREEVEEIFFYAKNDDNGELFISRGEYLCAKIVAKRLDYTFVDAKDLIFFGADGKVDMQKTCSATEKYRNKKIVVPGFYGTDCCGNIKLFERGGGDITGAVLACAFGAKLYENWTDVSGIMPTGCNNYGSGQPIEKLSYEDFFKAFPLGVQVINTFAVELCKKYNVPIRVSNTFKPNGQGTQICG